MKKNTSKHKNEPIDVSKLTTLKDLILAAMGPPDKNIVNFKMVQAILMILAQQLRMLERPVDYRNLEEDKTAQSERETVEREKGEKAEGESEKSEVGSEESERESFKSETKSEKSEGDSEKAERESEKTGRKRQMAGREKEKTGREKEKTGRKKEKTGREIEQTEGEKEKTGQEREKEKTGREREQTERGEEKTGQEREKTGPEKEETGQEREKEKTGREKEQTEREEEKTGQEREKTGPEKGKAEPEREKEKTGKERDKTEEEKEKTREIETSERESEKSERESEKSERESLKSERETEKTGRKKEKGRREKEKTGRDRDKTGQEREKTGYERENTESEDEETGRKKEKKTGYEKENTESEDEETGRKKEKKGREREKTGRERKKIEEQKEKTEPEREKEKTGREEEMTEAEREKEKKRRGREKIGREREEKERNIPLMEKADRKKEKKDKPSIEESFISITDKDKVLVVEKLPTSRRGAPQSRVGSIPVVTLSQFKLLEAAVKALEEKASPIPFPSMPDNKTLRDDLAKGSASLSETMQAMQVSARVQAAEEAINRMSEILSDMAAKGVVPEDLAGKMQFFADEKAPGGRKRGVSISSRAKASRSSVFGAAQSKGKIKAAKQATEKRKSVTEVEVAKTVSASAVSASGLSASGVSASGVSAVSAPDFVTHPEMDEALCALRQALTNSIFAMTSHVQKAAELSLNTASDAAAKATLVSKMDHRLKNLTDLLNSHTEELALFDAGVSSQMDSFNGQIRQVKGDLNDGLIMFDSASSGLESQAMKDLREKYDKLVELLDMAMYSLKDLATTLNQQDTEVQGITESVEMLQEEKSDRDEMLDRLRDKADISALDCLLPAKQFDLHQKILEEKLGRCHGKFHRQESVWESALDDLARIIDDKSDLLKLLKLKEDTENQLSEINKKLRCLAYALGEPKAALLARQLSQGARCGACSKPAIQDAMDKTYFKDSKDKPCGKPARLPPAYFSYIGAGDPCDVETNAPTMEEKQQHVCHRWVGGSHTLINTSVNHTQAAPISLGPPGKKYQEYGDDGKLYNMEESLNPCQNCSTQADEKVLMDGAGDIDHMVHVIGVFQAADK